MASWATRRKVTYLSIVGAALFLLVVVPLFLALYEKPTCFDGKRNGDEHGPDCGGSCVILCSFEQLEPLVLWSRVFHVSGNMYSAVAYVENPNLNSEAYNVPYSFKVYDDANKLITERAGVAYIPKNKRFAIFEAQIETAERKPQTVRFEFTAPPVWRKSEFSEPEIFIKDKALLREDISPRIEAELENRSLGIVRGVEVTAIVYDGNNNAVGASRTFFDAIDSGAVERAVFTWPQPFEAKLEVCEVPADIMLVVDRSGSMDDDAESPPQPLTDAKSAAAFFVDQLKETDRVGLVSFATEASDPADAPLSVNHIGAKNKIASLLVTTGPLGNTNLGGGLLSAFDEFSTSRRGPETKQVIVALTDGIATHPEKPDDPDYPLRYGAEAADKAKQGGAELYMIGLGSNVNSAYLQSIATTPEHYYFAATSKELKDIYADIATKICKKRPAILEIISLVHPERINY